MCRMEGKVRYPINTEAMGKRVGVTSLEEEGREKELFIVRDVEEWNWTLSKSEPC